MAVPFLLGGGPTTTWTRGQLVYPLIGFLAYQVQRSFKPFHPFIPVVPWPIRESQAGVQQLLHDASDLNPITYLILLQEVILDHFTQMLLCEENSLRLP